MCESLSLSHICSSCQDIYLKPQLFKRKISSNIEVISFYKYKDIKELLHTKHTDLGYYIYKILADNSMKKFADKFNFTKQISSIAIDDDAKSGYSHTSILNYALDSQYIKALHSKLRASNDISYSGKSRQFRLENPRNFKLHKCDAKEIILVDDIITTGYTLSQAISTLKANNKEVLFCLTLADVSLK